MGPVKEKSTTAAEQPPVSNPMAGVVTMKFNDDVVRELKLDFEDYAHLEETWGITLKDIGIMMVEGMSAKYFKWYHPIIWAALGCRWTIDQVKDWTVGMNPGYIINRVWAVLQTSLGSGPFGEGVVATGVSEAPVSVDNAS